MLNHSSNATRSSFLTVCFLTFCVVCVAAVGFADEPPVSPVAVAPATATEGLHRIEHILFEKTNAERVRAGLAPLKLSMELVQTSRKHAIWMCKTRRFEHSGYQVAENIAHNQRDSTEVMQGWMNSPGHRANILNPSCRKLGVAAYEYPTGGIYWVQQMLP